MFVTFFTGSDVAAHEPLLDLEWQRASAVHPAARITGAAGGQRRRERPAGRPQSVS